MVAPLFGTLFDEVDEKLIDELNGWLYVVGESGKMCGK